MRGHDSAEGRKHRCPDFRELLLQIANEILDSFALEILLRAAEIARNDRKFLRFSISGNICLAAVSERPDDRISAIVASERGRHRFHCAVEKEIEQKRF